MSDYYICVLLGVALAGCLVLFASAMASWVLA
jgi:hypothetical protein